jgi:hypothetical protein
MTFKATLDIFIVSVIVLATVCLFIYIGIDGVNRGHRRIFYTDQYGNVQPVLGLFRLCPYVARQLYTLAILQNDHCTITHEPFRIGDVAVMPCGHLYRN